MSGYAKADDAHIQLKIERLLAWCSMNGISISSDLEIRNDNSGGIGVFSRNTTIDPWTILIKIKKTSVLSIRSNTESSSGVMDAIPYGLDAQLELAVVLYVEILKGAKSRWHGYLQSLPRLVDVPLFWMLEKDINEDASNAVTWLRGTEAEKVLHMRGESHHLLWEDIAAFYENIAAHRITSLTGRRENAEPVPRHEPSLQGFFHAFSLVSSRAFVVDAYQGLAMVPIADVFNHTTGHHVHLETEFDVCPECGSYTQCDHDRDPKGRDSPILDVEERHIQDDLFYEMVTNAAIPPQAEVFNTYGEDLSNAQLLNRYGFVLDINENDQISWTLDDIFSLFPGISPADHSRLSDILKKPIPEIPTDIRDFLPLSDLLLYSDSSPCDAFFVESDGKCSLQLWMAIFCLVLHETDSRNFLQSYGQNNVPLHQMQSVLRLQLWLEGVYGSEEQESEMLPDGPSRSHEAHLLSMVAHRLAELCEERRQNTGKDGTSDMSLFDILDDQKAQVGPRARLAISIVATERAILESCELRWIDVTNHPALMVE